MVTEPRVGPLLESSPSPRVWTSENNRGGGRRGLQSLSLLGYRNSIPGTRLPEWQAKDTPFQIVRSEEVPVHVHTYVGKAPSSFKSWFTVIGSAHNCKGKVHGVATAQNPKWFFWYPVYVLRSYARHYCSSVKLFGAYLLYKYGTVQMLLPVKLPPCARVLRSLTRSLRFLCPTLR